MKKKSLFAFALLFALGTAGVSAFDWSQSWCNYGGGVKKGDLILQVDSGLGGWLLEENYGYERWTIPYTEAEVSYAGFIGKLPFAFGGFVGLDGHGYRYSSHEVDIRRFYTVCAGGDIAYHFQLPPKIIDMYVGARAGFKLRLGDYEDHFRFLIDPHVGANFFFSDFFGLNVEAGYENWLRAGLSFKF